MASSPKQQKNGESSVLAAAPALSDGESKMSHEECRSLPSSKQDYELRVINEAKDHKNEERQDDRDENGVAGQGTSGDDLGNDSSPTLLPSSPTEANSDTESKNTTPVKQKGHAQSREHPAVQEIAHELQRGLAIADTGASPKEAAATTQVVNKPYTKSASRLAAEGFAVADQSSDKEPEDLKDIEGRDKSAIPDSYYKGLEIESAIDDDEHDRDNAKSGSGQLSEHGYSDFERDDEDNNNNKKPVKKKKKTKPSKPGIMSAYQNVRVPVQGQDRLIELAQAHNADMVAAEKDEWW